MHPPSSSKQSRALPVWRDPRWLGLFLAALLFRIWSVAGLASDPRVADPILDGKYYLELAQRLAHGPGWPAEPIFMTPFYPWILGLIFRWAAAAPLTVQIFQALLGLATFVLLAATARRDLGSGAAWALAGLYAFCGPILGIESQVLTESLLLFLASSALYLWPRAGQPWWRVLLFGVTGGLLATGRGIFLLLCLAAAVHLFLLGRSRPGLRKSDRALAPPAAWPRSVGLLALGVFLSILPLAVHQTRSTGSLQLLTLNGGMNLYIGNNPSARGIFSTPPGLDLESDFTATRSASTLAGRDLTLTEASQFWTRRALSYLTGTPAHGLWLWARKALLYLSPREVPQIEDFQVLRGRHLPLKAALVDFAWILPLAVLGLVAGDRRGRLIPWLILIGVGWVSTILFFFTGRYRIPFLAGFLGPAALGVTVLVETVRRRRIRLSLAVVPLTVVVQLILPGYPVAKALAYDHYQAGLRLERRGNESAALEEYRRAIQLCPEDGQSWHGLGVTLVNLKRLHEAAEAYQRALIYIPNSTLTRYNLGIVYGRMGRDSLALGELREATRLDPFDVRIRSDLGVALARTGHQTEAVRELREALRRNPNYAPARQMLQGLGTGP